MKKVSKISTVLGIANLFFLVLVAVCCIIRHGFNNLISFAGKIVNYGLKFFQGIAAGNVLYIAILAVVAILGVFTIILMVMSITKKQAHFWSPISIPVVVAAICVIIVYPTVVTNVAQIGENLVLGLRCLGTILFVVGVLIYSILTSVAIVRGENLRKVAPVEEPAPAVEEAKEEAAPVEEPAPVVEEVEEEVAPVEEPAPAVEEVKEEAAPVEEPAPVVEEVKEEPKPEVKRESKPVFIIDENGNKVYPGRDFEDRLYEADPELLQMYSDLKNEFLSYRKVHTRVSKTNDAFRFEGNLVGKMIVSGKGLKVYLALDPLSVDSAIYHQRDASGKKKFVDTPLVVKVKSPLSFRKAKQLIALAMEKVGTVKKTRYTPIDWTKPNAKEKVEA